MSQSWIKQSAKAMFVYRPSQPLVINSEKSTAPDGTDVVGYSSVDGAYNGIARCSDLQEFAEGFDFSDLQADLNSEEAQESVVSQIDVLVDFINKHTNMDSKKGALSVMKDSESGLIQGYNLTE